MQIHGERGPLAEVLQRTALIAMALVERCVLRSNCLQ